MVLNVKQSFIAYRCPECHNTVYGVVGEFAMNANRMLKLKCPCGASELVINYTSDEKLRLSVPCLFCGGSHNYVVSPRVFFSGEIFLLACPYSNMDLCFIGTKDQVDEAVEHSNDELNQLVSELGMDSLSELRSSPDVDPDEILRDAQIYDIMRFWVKELEADGAIDCPCHSGDYDLNISDDGICIFCPVCGAEKVYPCESVNAALDVLATDRVVLTPRADDGNGQANE
ncbi:MAG: hypothetical protein ACI3XE_00260 [Eubacteriales bacterium]